MFVKACGHFVITKGEKTVTWGMVHK